MGANFVNIDRNTPMLLPVDLREWIPNEDMVNFVIESIEGMELKGLKINHRGSGSKQYPPKMMLSLLIYCYSNGIFGSRRIERATYRDIAVRYLTGDTHPDHDTIASFRRGNFEVLSECFIKVLELAKEMKILKIGTLSTDGTKIRANASKNKNVTYARAEELIKQLEEEVRERIMRAEEEDKNDTDNGHQLPEELARRETLRKKLEEARAKIEERARKRAEREREEYEKKVKSRESRTGKHKGKKIKEPNARPCESEQINLTDPDSRIMKKSKRDSYEQRYNAQAVVDAEGSQLIVGTRITQCASDRNELESNIREIPDKIGLPEFVVGDNGYANGEEIRKIEEKGIEVYVSVGKEADYQRNKYDFCPEKRKKKASYPFRKPWVTKMKQKMETEQGKKIYSLRKRSVEPVFGVIKNVMGFRQFLLRGLDKVTAEWKLVSIAYNMKRLYNIKMAAI